MRNTKRMAVIVAVLLVFGALSIGSGEDTNAPSSSSTDETKSVVTEEEVQKVTENITNADENDEAEASVFEGATISQKNAYKSALSYLNYSAFSYDGLIKQLEFEQFTTEDATWAVDNCEVDWNEQALKMANSYMDYTSFSHDSLIEQLEFEGFTTDQAKYAADIVFEISSDGTSDDSTDGTSEGSVSQENALAKAKDYLSYTAFSYNGLVEQLEFEGFTAEDAKYGADNCGADWNEQAEKKAAEYLDYSSFSRAELIEQLEFEGFTAEQATYGVTQNGF